MACGTPVIALNTTSIPEVTGDAALLISPNTEAPSLADEIFHLASNERKKADLVHKGLVRAKSFSWQLTADKTLDTYSKLVP
jgi:glycosyltransferase involved in cell wall biosynthesis